jgi:hypothetical protein
LVILLISDGREARIVKILTKNHKTPPTSSLHFESGVLFYPSMGCIQPPEQKETCLPAGRTEMATMTNHAFYPLFERLVSLRFLGTGLSVTPV